MNDISLSNEEKVTIELLLHQYLENLRSTCITLPISLKGLHDAIKLTQSELNTFIAKFKVTQGENDSVVIPQDEIEKFLMILVKHKRLALATRSLPRRIIVFLVSQYDAFLGKLLRFILNNKINNFQYFDNKTITYSKIMEFENIGNVQNYLVDIEVDGLMRESHIQHFKWMEDTFGMNLRKDLPVWQDFVELTERRNLFAHVDGKVSNQYLTVCKNQGVNLDEKIIVNETLSADKSYCEKAYEILFEIGVKLAHVFWRKFFPDEREKADKSLNDIGFDLLVDEDYRLAITVFDFALYLNKHFKQSSDEQRRIFIINLAQAHKWLGEKQKAIDILKTEDWSATSDEFKLAEAVINDDYICALKYMKSIGDNPEKIKKKDYKQWPLFQEFRKMEEFNKLYKEIFLEPFELYDKDEIAKELDSTS